MLSKSQVMRGIQCPKSLWLYKNKPELRDIPEGADARFAAGDTVGELATQLFPGGIDIPFTPDNFSK